jgi:glycosyltransferase involved in cell wall biosynthesis
MALDLSHFPVSSDQRDHQVQLTWRHALSIRFFMRIGFYAPLKSPNHPVPSGDRQMARMLMAALIRAGHAVGIASELRAFSASPAVGAHDEIRTTAEHEIARLAAAWSREAPPDLWFCYHPYYKAPDFIGPELARRFDLPYVTVEASWSSRRSIDGWAETQKLIVESVRLAAVNICMRQKDRKGLQAIAPLARYEMLDPFIDVAPFAGVTPKLGSRRIMTVAMMRPGDKLESYRMLARALERIEHLSWTLSIVGDGPAGNEVRSEFARLDPSRIEWLGEKTPPEIPALLAEGCLYAWPGFGEAYGLAYLEAQAAGLPVVAQDIDGVPAVVRHDRTGLLTPAGNVAAFADALARLLDNLPLRRSMSQAARQFVTLERSFGNASARLAEIVRMVAGPQDA